MKRHWIRTAVILAAAAGLTAALFFAVKSKKLQINRWIISPRDVTGVDISEYQADVDMEALAEQNVAFIYMKATEGSGYIDSRFHENWENAEEAGIPAGAYHFFSFDSPGKLQAENYVSTVGSIAGKLIPAVDIEYYGDKREDPPEPEEVAEELSAFLSALEEEYNVKPMIYCPKEIYKKYIKGYFDSYPRWIRSVYYPAALEAGGSWTVWQYSDTGELDGYEGGEHYIDLDVLNRGADLKELTAEG